MNEQERLKEALRIVLTKGMRSMVKVGSQGAEQMGMRALRKKQDKLYLKLGKEVEILAQQGEITHPGLQRGLSRLVEIQLEIEQLAKKQSE